jgi:hypothetical protein
MKDKDHCKGLGPTDRDLPLFEANNDVIVVLWNCSAPTLARNGRLYESFASHLDGIHLALVQFLEITTWKSECEIAVQWFHLCSIN